MSEEENRNNENASAPVPENVGGDPSKPVQGPWTGKLATERRVTKLNLRDDKDGPVSVEDVPVR